MTLLFKNTFFGGKDTKNNDTSKGIARKNNEMQIPTYFYEGVFLKDKTFFTLHQNAVYFCIIAISSTDINKYMT